MITDCISPKALGALEYISEREYLLETSKSDPKTRDVLRSFKQDAEVSKVEDWHDLDTNTTRQLTSTQTYSPKKVFSEWYGMGSRYMKRIYRVLNTLVPDVLENIYASVDTEEDSFGTDTILNATLSSSIPERMLDIANATYDDYAREYEAKYANSSIKPKMVERDDYMAAFYDDAGESIYGCDARNVYRAIQFLHLLKMTKVHSDTTLYSAASLNTFGGNINAGDIFEAKTPLCTSINLATAFNFHKYGDGIYRDIYELGRYDASSHYADDEYVEGKIKDSFEGGLTRSDSYIFVIKLKKGDSALPSSIVRDMYPEESIIEREREYTIPSGKFKVLRVDHEHHWIEIEPIRSGVKS